MSGIYGYVKTADDEKTAEARIKGLRRWNRDYGCDGEGEVCGKHFAVGDYVEHFANAFPAGIPVYEDGDLLYAIDAVIYNRDELMAAEDISDEELMVRIIKHKGFSELKTVNGDFAGAVLNRETGELRLFRDHLGVRPLYYYLKDGLLAFSTDIRGLGAMQDADLKIDERELWLKLAGYNSLSPDRTDFEYIRCVLPGSIMTFKKSGDIFSASTERYFVPGQNRIRLEGDEQYIARMRELIEDSIRRRLGAFPGKIGAELSGGLDSSVIDILINRMGRNGKYVAWRIVPDDWPLQPEDERIVIRDVAEQEGLDLEYLPETDYFAEMEKIVPVFDNTNQLGETAKLVSKEGIRVVFSGQGGDEGVSHRCHELELYRNREYGHYLREIWSLKKGRKLRLLRTLRYLLIQRREYLCMLSPWRKGNNAVPILNADYLKRNGKIKGPPFYFCMDPALYVENGGLRMRPETAAYQAAQYGVRYIFPFEDYRVLDYALSIPRNLYLRDGTDRWIFRKAFDDIMPESLKNVYYKDFPSIRNGRPETSFKISEAFRKFAKELDRDIWSGYLDFDAIEKLEQAGEPESEEDENRLVPCFLGLYLCYLIQRFLELKTSDY